MSFKKALLKAGRFTARTTESLAHKAANCAEKRIELAEAEMQDQAQLRALQRTAERAKALDEALSAALAEPCFEGTPLLEDFHEAAMTRVRDYMATVKMSHPSPKAENLCAYVQSLLDGVEDPKGFRAA